jgi:DNA-binding transcriptional LysR family regulator
MDLNQSRYFLALCEEKNFTRAAKRCGISQPSLSNAIKKLEQELGGQLFHRGRASCPLSERGHALRPHLAKLERCIRNVHDQAMRFSANGNTVHRHVLTSARRGSAADFALIGNEAIE